MRNILWTILFCAFILDFLKRKFVEKEIVNEENQFEEKKKVDFNPHKAKVPKEEEIDVNLELEPEGADLNIPPKPKERREDGEDNLEKVILNVKYCTVSYAKQFEQFKKDLIGNYTNIEVFGQEYPIDSTKKMAAKILWYLQMGMMVIIVGGQAVRRYLTFIPNAFFQFLDNNKFIVGLFNFMGVGYIMNQLNSSFAFEVTSSNETIWSKLASNALPTASVVVDVLKNKGYNLQ